ncbi:FOG: Ankyrin repeat [Plasmopara halstedii]|uniref:FOG: Ankyrin repeat n=1 Tax=Plasmopara halstedii TaxID=4781 RepID=A0A0P1AW03_PLAHL|nr:FOG: Ankyrin repeat [Plasmopara halstedii]CEG45737.1 FOG: Ankyrin repeat [Plasmopara halstedii]|eukprot:XP_024582106.1 FOG: Ankyrin repeat [Plasmopara halstedii]
MIASIPITVNNLDDEQLENAVFHEKQNSPSDEISLVFSRLLCCLRNRCLCGFCVICPCMVFLLLFFSLPSTMAPSTKRVFLVLAVLPPVIYILLALFTVILAYYIQVSLDNFNARAAHEYLRVMSQRSKIAATTGCKQRTGNFSGRFALFLEVARLDDAKTVQLCLESGQNVNESDHLGRTALHWAAMSGSDEVLSLLVRSGVYIDQKDTLDGLSALHYAAFYGHIKCTRLLVVAGASLTIMDNRKLNPLQLTEMAILNLSTVQPTHQMIIKYLRRSMKDDVTPPLQHIAGLTVLQLVERQMHNLPQIDEAS